MQKNEKKKLIISIKIHPLYIFTLSTYTVKPAKALLKGQQQIFVVKITPNDVKHYKHDLTFRLNDDEKYNKVPCPPIILNIE